MSEAKEWLLVKRDLYYRPDDLGYTGIRDHAGRYSYDEAKARVGAEVTMVKLSDAPEFTGTCFEDLARAHLAKQRDRLRDAIQEACDLLAERTYGSEARSPGHNARLRLEAALAE